MSIFCNRNKDTVTCMTPKIIKEKTPLFLLDIIKFLA